MTGEDLGLGVFIITLVLILIGVVVALTACQNSAGDEMVDSHLKNYSSFTVNGADFKSEDVVEYEYLPNGHENDAIVFNMKNGDEVHVLIDMVTWHK